VSSAVRRRQKRMKDCERVKAIEARRRAHEDPPPRGRRRALAAEGQYSIEDSGFAKMIAAKQRV
jgi:hypothetical protein